MASLVRQDFRGKLTSGTEQCSLNPNKTCSSAGLCAAMERIFGEKEVEMRGEEYVKCKSLQWRLQGVPRVEKNNPAPQEKNSLHFLLYFKRKSSCAFSVKGFHICFIWAFCLSKTHPKLISTESKTPQREYTSVRKHES